MTADESTDASTGRVTLAAVVVTALLGAILVGWELGGAVAGGDPVEWGLVVAGAAATATAVVAYLGERGEQ